MSPGCTNVTEDQELEVIRVWENLHKGMGHERVTCPEARKIRNTENRKQYSYAWWKTHPEERKAIQARHRQKKRNESIDSQVGEVI